MTDDPIFDGTDAARPAWWRAHDYTVKMFCDKVTVILDGRDDGTGFNYEPWRTVRRRLLAMAKRGNYAELLRQAALCLREVLAWQAGVQELMPDGLAGRCDELADKIELLIPEAPAPSEQAAAPVDPPSDYQRAVAMWWAEMPQCDRHGKLISAAGARRRSGHA